jgi:hypothetical protein
MYIVLTVLSVSLILSFLPRNRLNIIFLDLSNIRQYISTYLNTPSCKFSVIFLRLQPELNFIDTFYPKYHNIKFHGIPFITSRMFPCAYTDGRTMWQTDRQTDNNHEINNIFCSFFCEGSWSYCLILPVTWP